MSSVEATTSPPRSPTKKLIVIPTRSRSTEKEIELNELENGGKEKEAVLAEPSKSLRASESYEDAIERPSKATETAEK